MKKVLKLILVFAVISALCVSVFADSPETREIDTSDVAIVTSATTDASSDIIVEINPAPADEASANEAYAENIANKEAVLDSFEIVVTKDGVELHDGVTVDVTLAIPAEYVGMYLNLIENSDGAIKVLLSTKIESTSTTVSIKSFSSYTPVITSSPMASAVSPQTMQTLLPVALVVVAGAAIIGMVYAGKRRYN